MGEHRLTEQQLERVQRALSGGGIAALEQFATSDELHHFAWNYNWDNDLDDLWWIIRNPLCDKGTALLLYWTACPRWLYQYGRREEVPPYEREHYDFVKELEHRYLTNLYTHETTHVDPSNDRGTNWTTEYRDVAIKQQIPEAMFTPTSGRVLEPEPLVS